LQDRLRLSQSSYQVTVGFEDAAPHEEWGEWQGYSIELFGLDASVSWPTPGPFWQVDIDDGRLFAVEVWRRVARCAGSQTYAEVRWHPEHGEHTAIHWPGLDSGDVRRAERSLKLLREITVDLEALRRLREAAGAIRRGYRKVDRDSLASELILSTWGVDKMMRRAKVKLKDLR
jgi:hypothetical protein